MPNVTILGTALRPDVEWMRERAGAAWPAVLERLGDEDRRQIDVLNAMVRYPVALFGAVTSAFVAEVCGGSRDRAASEFRQMSRSVGEAQLSGVYSTLLRVSTPEGTLKRVAGLAPHVFQGCTCEIEFPASGDPNAVLRLNGLEEIRYAGPGLSGFCEVAMEKSGARDVTVRERTWDAGMVGSSHLVFEIRWA